MDMHQGQMCKLTRREDGADIGLYIRLRSSDGAQRYYRVAGGVGEGQVMGDQMIAYGDVDTSCGMKMDLRDKPYVISCVVPTEIQAKILLVNPTMDVEAEVSREAILFDIQRELKTINTEKAKLDRQLEQYRVLREHADTLNEGVNELTSFMDAIKRGEVVKITYAYGVHPNSPNEFCWRVPEKFKELVEPGLRAIGDTTFGPKEFTITRIEQMERVLPHRLMLSVTEPDEDWDL